LALASGLSNLFYPMFFRQHAAGQFACAIALGVCAGAAALAPLGRRAAALLLAAGVALLGLMALTWTWGNVGIDVFNAVSGATSALLHGHNPYSPTFSFYYEPTPFHGSRIPGHFEYGPIVPLLAAPGRLLGDVRAMSVVAVAAIIVGLWVLARQGSQRDHAHRLVAVALASPFSYAMVHQSWVDVYLVAGLVWWLALRRTHRGWATVALAVAVLVKPTSLIVLVPAFLWSRRARIEIAVAAAGSVIFALPFVLATGAGAFWYDVIGFQLALPPRFSALTLTSYVYDDFHVVLPSLLPLVALIVAAVLILWRGRPSDEADCALQAAGVVLAGLLVAKWAFFNYYYLADAMLLIAMAGAGVELAADEVARPWPLEHLHGLVKGRRPARLPAAAGM
jgi:hypothetical protein